MAGLSPTRSSATTPNCGPPDRRRPRSCDEEADRPVSPVRSGDGGHTVRRAMATDRAMAAPGRSTTDRAAAGADHQREHQQGSTTGTDMVAVSATRPGTSSRPLVRTPWPRRCRSHRREQKWPVEHDDRGDRHGSQQCRQATSLPLTRAPRRRAGSRWRRVLGAPAEEERAEAEHHHHGQGRHDVVPSRLPSQPMPSAATRAIRPDRRSC